MDKKEDWNLELSEYIKQGEPNRVEKTKTWETAIGLQDVDGLKPSKYLIKTAKEHIEGTIDIEEAKTRIDEYYEVQGSRKNFEKESEEADKVAVRITEILSEKAFNFSPTELLNIHKRLFKDIFDGAGVYRDYNFTKKELLNAAEKAEEEYQKCKQDIRNKGTETVKYIEENNIEIDIEADGGINLKTAEAVKEAGLLKFVQSLEKGLNSDVGNAGASLSGGQRQKIGIARALLSKAEYMIFDEATSSVDPESEKEIWETIGHLAHTRTLIIISHRMSSVRGADCIYVLKDGRVAQQGDHETLMAQDGLYHELVIRQQAMEVAE